jgi:hypothetical protein
MEELEIEVLGDAKTRARFLDRINQHKERLRAALGNFIVEIEKLQEE